MYLIPFVNFVFRIENEKGVIITRHSLQEGGLSIFLLYKLCNELFYFLPDGCAFIKHLQCEIPKFDERIFSQSYTGYFQWISWSHEYRFNKAYMFSPCPRDFQTWSYTKSHIGTLWTSLGFSVQNLEVIEPLLPTTGLLNKKHSSLFRIMNTTKTIGG